MKKIIIVCAGAFGREILGVLEYWNTIAEMFGKEQPYQVLGFIDDNLQALENTGIQVPILGKISDWYPKGDELYVLGAAFPRIKMKLSSMLKERGCRFDTVIAYHSLVSTDCIIGEGCFITAYYVSAGAKLGNFVNVNGSMICPGAEIDDFSTTTGFSVVEAAKVGKSVFIGSHAVISSGVQVGDFAQVSVGSIVKSDVPAGTTVFGVPARPINNAGEGI